MNRRGFFGRLLGAVVAAKVAPTLAEPFEYATNSMFRDRFVPMTYRGMPVVYDPACPPGTVYLLDPKQLRVGYLREWSSPKWTVVAKPLGVITTRIP